MKTLWKIAALITAVLIFAGCPPSPQGGGEPTNIAITKNGESIDSLTLAVDGSVELTVTADGADNDLYDWEIEEGEDYVQLNPSGDDCSQATIFGIAEGTAKITAWAGNSEGNVSKTITVTVTPALPNLYLTILDEDDNEADSSTTIQMNVDDEKTFYAAVRDEDGETVDDADFTWLSDSSCVSVEDGTITAISAGWATVSINASKEGYNDDFASASLNIHVSDPNLPTLSVTIKQDGTEINSLELEEGDNAALTAEVTLEGEPVSGASTSWQSSDSNIVSVNSSGTITAENEGTATITVTATKDEHNDGTATIEVTVTAKEVITPVKETIPWSWDKATQPWTSLVTGNNAFFYATEFPDVTVKSYGGAAPSDNGGIRLGGKGTAAPPRLVIGWDKNAATNANGATTANNATPPNTDIDIEGELDLTADKVKLTITYENLAAISSDDRILLRVSVNNNTNGGANSPLGNDSTIVNYRKSDSTNTESSTVKLTETSGTIRLQMDFTSTALQGLDNAFICLQAQQGNNATSNDDNGLTITSISIEYGEFTEEVMDLVIKDNGTAISSPIELDKDDTITLTADTDSVDATITWEITSGANAVELSATTGETVTITAKDAGTASIRVIANADGYETEQRTFQVKVTDASDVYTEPGSNVIFEWVGKYHGGPSGTFSSAGTDATLSGAGTYFTGSVSLPINYKAGTISWDESSKGIILDGYSTTSGANLLIGSNSTGNTTAGNASTQTDPPAIGVLDLNYEDGILVTLGFEILTPSTTLSGNGANRGFGVIIQNSTTTAGNSALNGGNNGKTPPTSTTNNIARIAYIGSPNSVSATANPGTHSPTAKTLVCKTIDPTDFNQANIEQLSTAFLGITTLGISSEFENDGTTPVADRSTGAKILITSIRIEKVD